MENVKYVDPNYMGPTLIRGYLKKLKTDMALVKFLKKFNKRYFILDLNNYFFGYQSSETASKIEKFSLENLRKVDNFPRITETCSYKFAFYIEIGNRDFFLYANSLSAHKEWCAGLCACLKSIPNGLASITTEKSKIPINHIPKPEILYNQSESKPEFLIEQEKPQPEDIYKSKPIIHEKNEKLPIKTSEPSYERPKDLPVRPNFIVVKKENEESKKKISEDLSDDEVKVISGPKVFKPKEDDYDRVVPIVYKKEKITQKKDIRPTPEPRIPTQTNQEKIISNPRSVSAFKATFEMKSGGISDMLNDLENIGVSNIEVRSGSELRQKISQKAYGSDAIPALEHAKHPNVSNVDRLGFFRQEEGTNKSKVKAISYRPITTKINLKPKYEEKPQVVPDETVEVKAKSRATPAPVSYRELKQKSVYKEVVPVPKANKSDWDNWDD